MAKKAKSGKKKRRHDVRYDSVRRGITVAPVKSSPYERPRRVMEDGAGEQFDGRIAMILRLQTQDGQWPWSAFPKNTATCPGWHQDRCAKIASDVLSSHTLTCQDGVLSTMCVLLKILQGYPRQRHLIQDAMQRAIQWLSGTLGVTGKHLEEISKEVVVRLTEEPFRIQYERRWYVRDDCRWISEPAGITVPKAIASRLEAEYRTG